MSEEICFSSADQQFIDRAINFCQQMGERAVLMLIGSRAAGFTDAWSDTQIKIRPCIGQTSGAALNQHEDITFPHLLAKIYVSIN